MALIEIRELSRVFRARRGGETVALDRVSTTIGDGEAVGLLGENGAGKTTLMRIISTLLYPTAGQVSVAGLDVVRRARQVRRLVVPVFGGDLGFYGELTALENLDFFLSIRRPGEHVAAGELRTALGRAGLGEAADRKVGGFSKGMRQRLHLALAFADHGRVYLLDEPTVGLDPLEAERTRHCVAELVAMGRTVFLSSHDLTDIEQLTPRVLVLHKGRLVADTSVTELRRAAERTCRIVGSGPLHLPPGLDVQGVHGDAAAGPWEVTVGAAGDLATTLAALEPLVRANTVLEMSAGATTLERAYLEYYRALDGA